MKGLIFTNVYTRVQFHWKFDTILRDIDEIITEKPIEKKTCTKRKNAKVFPWWFKIAVYLISFACMGASIVLILFKGESFNKCES